VCAGNEYVCKHKRIFGKGNMQVNIKHYLDTLLRKPGAVRNSVALKSEIVKKNAHPSWRQILLNWLRRHRQFG
jgi:hypothetical protein